MPGALPSYQASRQTLKTTAMRLPLGHSQSGFFFIHVPAGAYRQETHTIKDEFNHSRERPVETP
jgi:hypothetical protein